MRPRRLEPQHRPHKPEPGLLTSNELALRWRVSYETLARWRRCGRGPKWFRLGETDASPVRYRLEDVEAHERQWGQMPADGKEVRP